jgi:hypothetical protein
MNYLTLLVFFLILPYYSHAQTVMDNFDQSDREKSRTQTESLDQVDNNSNNEKNIPDRDSALTSDLITETIYKISPYGKIIILTNHQNSYAEGDYLTIVKDQQLISRVLAIKSKDNKSGIKIVRIYNPEKWKSLRTGEKIQLIKGDDSYFSSKQKSNKKNNANEEDQDSEILSEEDLLKDLHGVTIEEDKKRAIRTDNIISIFMGQTSSLDNSGNAKKYPQWGAQWAYQIKDNFWVEGSYGRSEMKNFPSEGANSSLNLYLVRIKYTVEAPYLFYIQPYLGYKYSQISAPGSNDSMTAAQKDQEKKNIKDAEKKGFIFGISVLKRLVPGWFFKADLGTDLLSAGLGFEF